MKMKKIMTSMLALAMVAGISAGSTYAWLISKPDPVINTFTTGKVIITLDESDVTNHTSSRVTTNDYRLIPGHTYVKDPELHVDGQSEDCYIFVKVVNPLGEREAKDGETRHRAENDAYVSIAKQIEKHGWKLVKDETNVYYQEKAFKANDNIIVFDEFMVNPDATAETLKDPGDIVITGYAVQQDGFQNAIAAWNANKGTFTKK